MNKRKVEKLIPIAIDCVKNSKGLFVDGKIPGEYKGYIANFGASIIQSGLFATLAFYAKTDAKSKSDRCKLLEVIANVIYTSNKINDSKKSLMEYVKDTKDNKSIIKEEVINAAIAVKLAMGVFEFVDKSEEE